MNSTELWTRWIPNRGITGRYWHTMFTDDGTVRVVMSTGEDPNAVTISFVFTGRIDLYMETEEAFKLSLWEKLKKNHGRDFYASWSFFKVTNSQLIASILGPHCDTRNKQHFVISDYDDVIEIVTDQEPIILIGSGGQEKKIINTLKNIPQQAKKFTTHSPYTFVSLCEIIANSESLSFRIRDQRNHVSFDIIFDCLVGFFSKTIAFYKQEELLLIQNKYKLSSFAQSQLFFELTESPLQKKMSDESGTISDSLKHFIWVTDEYVIDVLATFEPKIEVCHANELSER